MALSLTGPIWRLKFLVYRVFSASAETTGTKNRHPHVASYAFYCVCRLCPGVIHLFGLICAVLPASATERLVKPDGQTQTTQTKDR